MFKKKYFFLFFILFALQTFAQENNFFYQGTFFDQDNKPFKNSDITVKISIIKDSMYGTTLFSETHTSATNDNGLFTLVIGNGLNLYGQLDLIDWSASVHYIYARINLISNPNFMKIKFCKINSVPYALYARKVDSIANISITEFDPTFLLSSSYSITQNDINKWNIDNADTNEIQQLYFVQDTLHISNGNSIPVNQVVNDYNLLNNTPVLPTSMGQLTDDLNFIPSLDDDNDPLNEIQNLSISFDTIFLSGGGFVKIPLISGLVYNYDSIINKPNIPDSLSETLNDQGYLWDTGDGDFDPTNEKQTLSIDPDAKLSLSKSNYINLPINTGDNQSFNVSELGDTLFLINGNFVIIPGISQANVNPFNPQLIYNVINDVEGNTYKTIVIGQQEWMAENLRSTKFSNGDLIPITFDNSIWSTTNFPAYTFVNNDIKDKNLGNLYNWHTVVDPRNVCPTGWHVPSDEEWTVLADFLGGQNTSGKKLKSTNLAFWNSPNLGANNDSGFSGLPMGLRNINGSFANFGINGYWWSVTQVFDYTAFSRFLNYNDLGFMKTNINKNIGCSVRCLRN